MNCLECQKLLQDFLDGSPIHEQTFLDEHLSLCEQCRRLYGAAQRLRTGLRTMPSPTPPADLSQRLAIQVLRERRLAARRRLSFSSALAASILLLVIGGYYREHIVSLLPRNSMVQDSTPVRTPALPSERSMAAASSPSPDLRGSMAEASSSLLAISRRTVKETLGQTRWLLPNIPIQSADTVHPSQSLDDSTRPLREVSANMSAGLAPVTKSARRAFDLFFREMPAVTRGDTSDPKRSRPQGS